MKKSIKILLSILAFMLLFLVGFLLLSSSGNKHDLSEAEKATIMNNAGLNEQYTLVLKTEVASKDSTTIIEKTDTVTLDGNVAHILVTRDNSGNSSTEYFYDYGTQTIYLKAGDQWVLGDSSFGLKIPINLENVNHLFEKLETDYVIENTADGYTLTTATLNDAQKILNLLDLEALSSGMVSEGQLTLVFNQEKKLTHANITLSSDLNETTYTLQIDYNHFEALQIPDIV